MGYGVPQFHGVFPGQPQPMQMQDDMSISMSMSTSTGAVRAASATPSAGPEMELPPLRRMGDRSIADAVDLTPLRPLIDGIGDRERSPPAADEENWTTMLATIAPDARLPSASSSFATQSTASFRMRSQKTQSEGIPRP